MIHLKRILLVFCILFTLGIKAQINITGIIKDSKLVNTNENKLYFIDFWATWCAPCIHVSKQLAVLQQQYPNDFYVASLTQENPETVKKFLEKHHTDLAVVIDFNGETFNEYNVKTLPYGILFNAKGRVLWKGHPADFKPNDLEFFLAKERKKISIDTFLIKNQDITLPEVVEEEDYFDIKTDFKINKIENPYFEEAKVINDGNLTLVEGNLSQVLAYAFKASKRQVVLNNLSNDGYRIVFKNRSIKKQPLYDLVLDTLNLNYTLTYQQGACLIFNLDDSTLWDLDQINWGAEQEKFLIDDSQIIADNADLNTVKYKLSNLLDMPIIIDNANYDLQKHDWQIHYKYYDLMVGDLLQNYGITVKQEDQDFPIYNIENK